MSHGGRDVAAEAGGPQRSGFPADLGGVEDAVEHEPADALREQVRVHRPEERPVGLADVVQPLLAERGTQQVHVARRVLGRDVVEQVAGLLPAGRGERGVGCVHDRYGRGPAPVPAITRTDDTGHRRA